MALIELPFWGMSSGTQRNCASAGSNQWVIWRHLAATNTIERLCDAYMSESNTRNGDAIFPNFYRQFLFKFQSTPNHIFRISE